MKTAAILTAAAPSGTTSFGFPRIGNNGAFFVAVNPRSVLATVSCKHTQVSQGSIHRSSLRRSSFIRTPRCSFLMDVVVRSGVEPGSVPSDGSPGSWKLWILGMVISVVLPFWKSKWGPLLKLKNEVDTMLNVVEHVAEVVETVAEKVEEVVDEVGDHLPAGRLKKALEIIEDVADEVGKDAHRVDALIEKVEQMERNMEKEVETIIEFGPALSKSATAEPSKSSTAEPVLTYQEEATDPSMDPAAAIEPAAKESEDHN